MILLFWGLAAFGGIKLYGQYKNSSLSEITQSLVAEVKTVTAGSGTAPANGNPASPTLASQSGAAVATPTVSGDADDDGDDGAMTATVAAVTGQVMGNGPTASQIAPGAGDFDINETQDSSGSENAGSQLWRQAAQGPKGSHNITLNRLWREVLDVDYISSQPGIIYRHAPPPMTRQDWNPSLNNQPWARNTAFQATDPSSYWDEESGDSDDDSGGESLPSLDS